MTVRFYEDLDRFIANSRVFFPSHIWILINLIISVQTCTEVLFDIRVVEPAGLHGAVREVSVHDLALPVQVPLQQGRTSATIKDDLWRKRATE
jgi:hypothetical protein